MEYRRKSGRAVSEWFFLPSMISSRASPPGRKAKERVILLEDHPLYRASEKVTGGDGLDDQQEGMASTFDLGLTEKQKRDREGVVLPYFDAQKSDGGVGAGGRILYEMGFEDDFDEEEDEI
ncbi:MAG: hypothetical protein M1832_003061 [Thelocarpon impressellum]|nr:MAG: hypothetical protein M1832_003061 [Thelocarpon impressellum]